MARYLLVRPLYVHRKETKVTKKHKVFMLTTIKETYENRKIPFASIRLAKLFFLAFYFLFFIFLIFIVIQLQLYAFSPRPSTPPQPNPPPSPISTLPLGFVHLSFIVVPVIPSSHCPPPTPAIVRLFLTSMSLVIFCLLFSSIDYVPVKGEIRLAKLFKE